MAPSVNQPDPIHGRYPPGTPAFKEYTVRGYLGQGGYGRVYRVENELGLSFALKVLHRDIQMERRGVRAVMSIRSNRLVAILDFGRTHLGDACILMEYVPHSLADRLTAGPLPAARATALFDEILKGLEVLETHGIVHRDIKPANLFVLEDVVKIGDFGTARYTSGQSTAMSVVAGTVHYMAPERFRPGYGFSVDRWAAAVVFFHLLTGKLPFEGADHTELFGAIMQTEPDLTGVPAHLRGFLRTSLAKPVERRFANLAAMRAALHSGCGAVAASIPRQAVNCLGMTFVRIAAGRFRMGSPADEPGRAANERAHPVTLTRPFGLQTTPVTVAQWQAFAEASGYVTDAEQRGGSWIWTGRAWEKRAGIDWRRPGFPQSGEHPVTCMSWNDARALATWLGEREARRVDLPTEAQWEYACRAGASGPYGFDDARNDLDSYAWYWHNAGRGTCPVATRRANAWGLYDMHGNVWEWCRDWYGPYPEAATDPTGAVQGSQRVWRGGSWSGAARTCRAAYRRWGEPAFRYFALGFRLVLPA